MAKIGLILGAGGVIGHAYHVGVLSALAEELGWDARSAEIIVGTSAGAHVGAYLRAGMPPTDLYARLLDRPLSTQGQALTSRVGPPVPVPSPRTRSIGMTAPGLVLRGAITPMRLRPAAMIAALMPRGRVSLEPFAARVRWLFGSDWPQEPLWLPAVDLRNGRRVVFGKDGAPRADIGTAVAASCSVPGWFAPVKIGERHYVDGGVHSPTNADLLARQDLDLVIVSSPMSVARGHWRPRAALNGRGSLHLLLATEVGQIRASGTAAMTFQPTVRDLEAMGFNGMSPRQRVATAIQARESTLRRLGNRRTRDRLAMLAA